jgi:esterase/lipase
MLLFRKAIVIIHGFTGNMYDNEYLMNYLEYDSNFDVYAETLPGHNQDRFSDASVTDWKRSIEHQIQRLIDNGYHTIYVIGHSMGGILACYAAARYSQIKKVVLVNAAFDYLNYKQNKNDLKDKDFKKYSHLWQKALRTSPFMVNEFRKLVKESNEFLKKVDCDTLILRSVRDEIIPYEVGDLIYSEINSKNKYLVDITEASHVVLSGEKKDKVSKYIELFLKGGRKWKKNIKIEI